MADKLSHIGRDIVGKLSVAFFTLLAAVGAEASVVKSECIVPISHIASCGDGPCAAHGTAAVRFPAENVGVNDSVSPNIHAEKGENFAPDTAAVRAVSPDLLQPADTARLREATDSIARQAGSPQLPPTRFVPDPQRALWLSLVFPGAGQIYNRKYWKLPIIYGGFLGCVYALMWNQQMYRDYSQAYLDIMDDDPNTNSYLEMLPPRYDITGREEQFKSIFKRKKDYYRRYRDLSAFCFVGVYLLSVIDAYVDAQLSVFDISPDLTMSVAPAVLERPESLGMRRSSAYGVGCSLRF